MVYTTLITTPDLEKHMDDPTWVIVDCRFSLDDTGRGKRAYLQSHIPGAVYAHLDQDLSSPVIPGITGRHPLPAIDEAARTFSRWGIDHGVQVVAYDDAPMGLTAAARLWWMLRWLGHDAVAVLDGGWDAWRCNGRPTRDGLETHPARGFTPRMRPELYASAKDVERVHRDPSYRVIDARSADRYRGENEILDPVAGHIAGALSAPYIENFLPDGRLKSREEIRARLQPLLGGVPAHNTIFYCGSGVTGAHDVLAMVYAGLGEPRLYAGSWSEWITDASRPVEK